MIRSYYHLILREEFKKLNYQVKKRKVTIMKIIEVNENHQLCGNLQSVPPDGLSLYKQLLIKNKDQLFIKVKTSTGERLIQIIKLHKNVQQIIMHFLHREALAGRHI